VAIALVGQAGQAGNSAGSPLAITYSSTAHNTLILTGHLYDSNAGAFVAPTSVTDSTGGTNAWHISTSATQAALTVQTPPLCSITDPSDGGAAHFANFVAWCIGAAAVTSVTLAWEGGLSTWRRVALSEWSGIAQFDQSWAGGSTTGTESVTSGPFFLRVAGELILGDLDYGDGGTSSLPASWTGLTSGGGGNAYRLLTAVTGSYSPAWTNTASAGWAGAIAVFSPSVLYSGAQPEPASARLPGHQAQSQQVYQPGLINVN